MKSFHLESQPLRDIEKLAFQGQHAARMGIIVNLYMQQALGHLLQTSSKEANLDSAVQCVRDIFAKNTKSLDQLGQIAAIHHLIRRKCAMADTGLNEPKDIMNQIWNLSLSHEGVFGPGLEQTLNDRVEINKHISDLLPQVDRRGKRRSLSIPEQPWKRARFGETKRNQNYRSFNNYGGAVKQQYKPATATASYPRFPKTSMIELKSTNKLLTFCPRLIGGESVGHYIYMNSHLNVHGLEIHK
ncbi:hypothetical protein DPMN_163428 [Dreissena polymorpha]|uniref:Uncharacterized protein n=1 Tax=Dreissena polymorpha TaxID=45954 RepID=A0A9D4ET95_DREPO|nr:hypothetical protein DPMN_163428 [Dreissena polymorpha]